MKLPKRDYPFQSRLAELLVVIKAQKMAEVSCIIYVAFSKYIKGGRTPTQATVDRINAAIDTIAEELADIRLDPATWQSDCEHLKEYIKIKHVVEKSLGIKSYLFSHRLKSKNRPEYGKLYESECNNINDAIRAVVLRLEETRLVLPVQENTPHNTPIDGGSIE